MGPDLHVDDESVVLPPGSPVILVNLLRFKDMVEVDSEVLSGAEAYARYVSRIARALVKAGGRPILTAKQGGHLLGHVHENWDELIVVWYPSGAAFHEFANSDECQSNLQHRDAALTDSRLMAFTSPRRIGRMTAAVFALSVRLRHRPA